MTRLAPLLVLLVTPIVARADGGPPIGRSIPADVVIETDREYPEYLFILDSGRRVEVLKIAPGRPCPLSAAEWVGEYPRAFVYAIPAKDFDGGTDEQSLRKWVKRQQSGYGKGQMSRVDFSAGVWFYDTRRRVVNTYHVKDWYTPPVLVLDHQTPESTREKIPRYAVGLFLTAAAVLCVRLVWKRRAAPASG